MPFVHTYDHRTKRTIIEYTPDLEDIQQLRYEAGEAFCFLCEKWDYQDFMKRIDWNGEKWVHKDCEPLYDWKYSYCHSSRVRKGADGFMYCCECGSISYYPDELTVNDIK